MSCRTFQQVDEIIADSSSSIIESDDETLEVNPPSQNQVLRTLNSHNETDVSNRSDDHDSLEHQNNVAYPPTMNVCPHTENYSQQEQVANNLEGNRIPLGHFVENNKIQSYAHHKALVGLMQLAYGNANGILASIGYTNQSSWINQNIDDFFSTRWPT